MIELDIITVFSDLIKFARIFNSSLHYINNASNRLTERLMLVLEPFQSPVFLFCLYSSNQIRLVATACLAEEFSFTPVPTKKLHMSLPNKILGLSPLSRPGSKRVAKRLQRLAATQQPSPVLTRLPRPYFLQLTLSVAVGALARLASRFF